jgi:hypothetical protein
VENLGVTPKVPFVKLHCVELGERRRKREKETHDAVDVRGGIPRKRYIKIH